MVPNLAESTICANLVGHYGEHSCEIIFNLDQWFRCDLKKRFTAQLELTKLSW